MGPLKKKFGKKKKRHNQRFTRSLIAEKKLVQRIVRQDSEKKYFLAPAFNQTAISYSGSDGFTQLTAIPQGSTDSTRDGDQLTLRSIELRLAAVVADSTNLLRVIMFQWFPNSTPSWTSISAGGVSSAYACMAPYNHDNRFMYRILYDKLFSLSTVSNYIESVHAMIIDIKHRKVQYNGGSTTLGSNQVYIAFMSDSAAVAHPTITGYIKVNYSDG